MANPYANSVIYKLYADDIDEVYIGSTTDMKRRMGQHNRAGRSDDADCYSAILYALSDYEIKYEILERCSAKDRAEKEREHMLTYPTRVNKEIPQLIDPAITGKERQIIYRSLTKDKAKERSKKSYVNTKSDLLKHRGTVIVCECGANTTVGNQTTHRKSKKHIEFLKKNI